LPVPALSRLGGGGGRNQRRRQTIEYFAQLGRVLEEKKLFVDQPARERIIEQDKNWHGSGKYREGNNSLVFGSIEKKRR
jgi:hypothetical protein